MKKIIVSVAPVNLEGDAVSERVSPKDIAKEVWNCTREGAGIVHLHVRDDKGYPTEDLQYFSETLELIRQNSNIIIQGSTGGCNDLTLDQRCVSLNHSLVEMATLNMGSTNFGEEVYVNSLSDIRYWAHRIYEKRISPELEIFNGSMLHTTLRMYDEKILSWKLNFALCLGFPSSTPADYRDLSYMYGLIPKGSIWGLIHHGMKNFEMMACAIALGADYIRVGFEDSGYYANQQRAVSNAQLVEEAVKFIKSMGYDIATPDEARGILGL